jgi:hypothetical protein
MGVAKFSHFSPREIHTSWGNFGAVRVGKGIILRLLLNIESEYTNSVHLA